MISILLKFKNDNFLSTVGFGMSTSYEIYFDKSQVIHFRS